MPHVVAQGTSGTRLVSNASSGGVQLYHHSFERELTYDSTLGDWLSSAATMALRDRVQLLPPVPDRHAVFWNKLPMGTGDFEVSYTFSAYSRDHVNSVEDGFVAAWISLDDYAKAYDEQAIVSLSKDWKEGATAAGLTFLDNRPSFRGLAVIFLGKTGQSASGQSVVGVWSDGSKALSLPEILAEGPNVKATSVDWLTGGTQVKLRVLVDGSVVGSVMTLDLRRHFAGTIWGWAEDGNKIRQDMTFEPDFSLTDKAGSKIGAWEVLDGNRIKLHFNGSEHILRVEGSQRAVREMTSSTSGLPRSAIYYGSRTDLSDKDDWREVFSFPPGTFPVGAASPPPSFVGFTGWTGSASWLEVDLHRLETRNFDMQRMGEASVGVLEDDTDAWLKVLESEKRYVTQADQKQAVQRLTQLLSDHMNSFDKDGEQLKQDLVKLDDRIESLGEDLATYFTAYQALDLDTQQFNSKVVTDHIIGIRSLLMGDKEAHDARLVQVHQAARDLKDAQTKAVFGEAGKAKVRSVADQTLVVEEFAAKGSSQINMLLILIAGTVLGLGLLFYNRMRYYERKHYI